MTFQRKLGTKMKLGKYLQLKKQAQTAQQQADQAKGALNAVMQRLEKEFGCKNLTEAKRKLKELAEEESRLQKEFDEAVEEFEKKWAGAKSNGLNSS